VSCAHRTAPEVSPTTIPPEIVGEFLAWPQPRFPNSGAGRPHFKAAIAGIRRSQAWAFDRPLRPTRPRQLIQPCGHAKLVGIFSTRIVVQPGNNPGALGMIVVLEHSQFGLHRR